MTSSSFSIQIIPPRKIRSPTFAIPATIQSTSCLKCNEKEVQVIEGKILINDVSNWYLWNRRRCCHLPRLLRKADFWLNSARYLCLCPTAPSSLQLLPNLLLFTLLLMMSLWWSSLVVEISGLFSLYSERIWFLIATNSSSFTSHVIILTLSHWSAQWN